MAETRIVEGREGLEALVGQQVGATDWIEISQEQVDQFADATGDHQWIHVDVERAADGPFGGTIAHGFLTLGLIPRVLTSVVDVQGFSMVVNYGLDKVRFPAPVPVGAKVRGVVVLDEVSEAGAGVQVAYQITIEVDGSEKPACVARFLERRFA
ncbi:MaoC family dehydratase [Egicoccus halophilus]|uniref:MaoC family dehydratase n=1 Tax=Egicoccus halophilus TaxID=1670830 RepID=A0A8J3ABH9_9ACTN|nr:MaoC family dehydratase [Egicoccus halophilus]GGI04151.1 MaoC family dehydratase [Egicoccus halophilus]